MDKLSGVNEVLTRAGFWRVETLNTGGTSDVALAEHFLDRENLSVQSQGWHFNTRRDVTLTPDGDGKIALPAGCLLIDTCGQSESLDVTQLGDALYDLTNNTAVFTGPIRVEYTLAYEFHCLPQPVAEYVVARAAMELNLNRGVRPDLRGMLNKNVGDKREAALTFDQTAADVNIFDSPGAVVMLGGRRRSLFP